MTDLTIVRISSFADMQRALAVRRSVFIEEQGVPEDLEIDEHDSDPASVTGALHVLALRDRMPVATGRLIFHGDDGHAHIGRVAVLAAERRRGCGSAVMAALHGHAGERGTHYIRLAAQLHAIPFYEKLGYAAFGDAFLDAGIEHRWMEMHLD